MTLQVGMVGTDGVLIASDTQWTYNPRLRPNEMWAAGRTRSNSPKIVISHGRGMAISRARSMETAGHVASQIIAKLQDEDLPYPIQAIEAIGSTVLASVDSSREDAQCLIALLRPTPRLFLFQFGTINGEWGPICSKMQSIAVAGDNLNSAIFWAERYYTMMPVEKLVPLAAHLVCQSHYMNTATISGLEIVLCTASGIRRLSDESIAALEKQSADWDKAIGDFFLSHSQQFTYAPDVAG